MVSGMKSLESFLQDARIQTSRIACNEEAHESSGSRHRLKDAPAGVSSYLALFGFQSDLPALVPALPRVVLGCPLVVAGRSPETR